MPKITTKSFYLPQVYPFSDYENEDGDSVEFGDGGESFQAVFNSLDAEIVLSNLLLKMSDRQKIILMFLVLREMGYKFSHKRCAELVSVSREHYMVLLREVRNRVAKLLQERVA